MTRTRSSLRPITPAVPAPRTSPETAEPAGTAASVGEADLLPVLLVHRLARRDTRRLAAVADGLASGTTRFSEKRALAFGEWVEHVCSEIAGQHAAEDEVVWPLLERHARSAVDLADLTGDHAALRSLLGEARRRVRSVVAALVVRPSPVATAADFARMRELATVLDELAELVAEHLDETERVVLAVVTAHVPRPLWLATLDELRARPDGAWVVGPRLRAVADAAELPLLRHGGLRELRLRLATGRFRRRERLVYGVETEGVDTDGATSGRTGG